MLCICDSACCVMSAGTSLAGQHRYQPKSPKSWVKTSDLKADELVRLYWARQQAADGQDQLHVARRGQLASAQMGCRRRAPGIRRAGIPPWPAPRRLCIMQRSHV